jgi:dTDP-D-glucose 4,6-dehydratase
MSGKKIEIITDAEGLGREYSGENAHLMNEIKDFQFTPFREAIRALYKWYEQNKAMQNMRQ